MSQEEKLNKIITLSNKTEANEYAEKGYRLHTYSEMMIDGSWSQSFVMTLDLKYEDVVNIADVPTQDAKLYLDQGWEIASASISTKFVRMIYHAKPATQS